MKYFLIILSMVSTLSFAESEALKKYAEQAEKLEQLRTSYVDDKCGDIKHPIKKADCKKKYLDEAFSKYPQRGDKTYLKEKYGNMTKKERKQAYRDLRNESNDIAINGDQLNDYYHEALRQIKNEMYAVINYF